MRKDRQDVNKANKPVVPNELVRDENAWLAKSQFLSVMSHELLTPMNAIVGFTNLLLEDPREDQLENLRLLKFSTENLLTLIKDLLDFHVVNGGGIKLQEAELPLDTLLKKVIATHQPSANVKNLTLTLEISPPIAYNVIADGTRLAQILNNLIGNAIKFTCRGSVHVKVNEVKQEISAITVHFAVNDTGIGIPKDKQQMIFDAFSQVNSNDTRIYGGTGIGLAISNRLLQLMGSGIEVKSRPGSGSSFYFTVKFVKGEPIGKLPSKEPEQALTLNGMKVLLAEDNPINVFLMKKFFVKWKVDFAIVENGQEALDNVQLADYHLVLMDLQMPVMDGYQATIAIRNLAGEKYRHLPIMAVTASAAVDVEEKTRSAGMNDFIRKPFKPEDLYNKMLDYFQRTETYRRV